MVVDPEFLQPVWRAFSLPSTRTRNSPAANQLASSRDTLDSSRAIVEQAMPLYLLKHSHEIGVRTAIHRPAGFSGIANFWVVFLIGWFRRSVELDTTQKCLLPVVNGIVSKVLRCLHAREPQLRSLPKKNGITLWSAGTSRTFSWQPSCVQEPSSEYLVPCCPP